MICATITARTNRDARADLLLAAAAADLAELRLDFLAEKPDLRLLLEDRPCRVIVTNRAARQGGSFGGSEAERIAPLREAVQLGADYVDLEYDAIGRLGDRLGTRIIASYHDFEKTPGDLRGVARMLLGTGADVIKIATYVNDITETFRLCQMAFDIGVPKIVVGMGPKGLPTRVLTRKFGGLLTYAALRGGAGSAPGQLTAAELRDAYNFDSTGPDTPVYGVIGNPIMHSVSPHIHNAAFRHLGMNAVYVPFEVDALAPFFAGVHCLDPAGFSVTIPHKEEALRLVDEADDISHKIGAVNTVAVRDNRLVGANTDWLAAVNAVKQALAEDETLAGRRVLLLGAGGAARAIAYGLAREKALVLIANRTRERAERLAAETGAQVIRWDDRGAVDCEAIVNSTSIGMYPDLGSTPMPADSLRQGCVVFDAVYNPRRTRLIEEAAAAGCRVVEGIEMFVEQAVAQFQFWTGREAPVDVMRKATIAALSQRQAEP
jgi:3-dehydroquinate dehydratase/shikimate dehydrogenase